MNTTNRWTVWTVTGRHRPSTDIIVSKGIVACWTVWTVMFDTFFIKKEIGKKREGERIEGFRKVDRPYRPAHRIPIQSRHLAGRSYPVQCTSTPSASAA